MAYDIAGLRKFLAVAEQRSFRAASEELGMTASAVSQAVRQLEAQLGVPLFARTTRSVALTEAGQRLYDGLRPAFGSVETAIASVTELRQKPAGRLRLNVYSIAESFLAEGLISQFLQQYPDIQLDIVIDDTDVDIVQQGFDAAVRLGEVVARDMVALSVSAPQRQLVVGAPSYFAAHGKPKHPRELHAHTCIGWCELGSRQAYRWEFTENGREFSVALDSRVQTNEMSVMLRLAREGVGLTLGMEETLRPYIASGELVTVLEKYCAPFPGFYLYYPSRTEASAKLRALIAFLQARARARSKSGRSRGTSPR